MRKFLIIFFMSMVPIVELRGAMLYAVGHNMDFLPALMVCVIGNMLPIPFILLFITKVIAWMQKCRVRFFNKVANWLVNKAEKNREKIEKYSFWGVCFFVALPLPVTGAWTGSLVAATIGMKFWKALLSCFIGILIAGVIVTCISYGALAAFSWLL